MHAGLIENAYSKEKEENSKKKVKDKEGHSQTQFAPRRRPTIFFT